MSIKLSLCVVSAGSLCKLYWKEITARNQSKVNGEEAPVKQVAHNVLKNG